MRQKVLIIAILILTSGSLFAQFRIGLRGGINASRLKGDREIVTPHPTTLHNYKITVPDYMMVGYHLGLVAQVQAGTLFIQPEALYTLTRNDIDVYDLNSGNPATFEQRLNRLDIPVLIGLKLKAFKLGVGPVMTFLISEDSDLHEITEYDLKMNNATLGYQAGIGLDIGHFTIDLKYEGSLSKLANGIKVSDNEVLEFDSRINQVILSFALFF